MAKPPFVELGDPKSPLRIPILYEDRAVLAIDKPAGWLLAPPHWQRTNRNLQAAVESSIAAGDFWARSRNLKFLRFIHRLDAETSGVLLLAKSAGAVSVYSALFESRRVAKTYLAVVRGVPSANSWTCQLRLAPDPRRVGRVCVNPRIGTEAETHFRLLGTRRDAGSCALVEARPRTGRMHQIRVHLAAAGHPVLGDELYGGGASPTRPGAPRRFPLALRAVALAYADPFTGRPVRIEAPTAEFRRAFGFAAADTAEEVFGRFSHGQGEVPPGP